MTIFPSQWWYALYCCLVYILCCVFWKGISLMGQFSVLSVKPVTMAHCHLPGWLLSNTCSHWAKMRFIVWLCKVDSGVSLLLWNLLIITTFGPFYQLGSTLIPTWIINHVSHKRQNEISYPFPNLKFRNGSVTLFYSLQWVWLLIHVGIKVNPFQ